MLMNRPDVSEWDTIIPTSQMGRMGARGVKDLDQAMGYLSHKPGSGIPVLGSRPLAFPHLGPRVRPRFLGENSDQRRGLDSQWEKVGRARVTGRNPNITQGSCSSCRGWLGRTRVTKAGRACLIWQWLWNHLLLHPYCGNLCALVSSTIKWR